MAMPTRDDLNAALDQLDAAKSARGAAKADAKGKAQAAADAKTASDAAAGVYTSAVQDVATALSNYQQLLNDYAAEPPEEGVRGMRSVPTSRR